MSMHSQIGQTVNHGFVVQYLEALALVERLHRLLLDVIKDEFERLGVLELNPVQALLLFNVGDKEVAAGELKSGGYYKGQWVKGHNNHPQNGRCDALAVHASKQSNLPADKGYESSL